MYKKVFISIAILLAFILSSTYCFANNGLQNVADGIRNIVGDAENAVEGAVQDMSNASKDATGSMENKANNVTNNMDHNNNTQAQKNNMGVTDNYMATRTSTTDSNTFMGMNATVWTWLILGIAAIAIIALVWYYSVQLGNNKYNNRD